MSQIAALLKWMLSFLRWNWRLGDYPLRYVEQGENDREMPRWRVQIVNWWVMLGLGETREEAYRNLEEVFEQYRQQGRALPRPGTKVPIEFASGDELRRYWGVARRIIEDVLGHDADEVFVSDQSSLQDFADGDDISEYLARIEEIFGVDVSHIASGNLAEISKYVHDNR